MPQTQFPVGGKRYWLIFTLISAVGSLIEIAAVGFIAHRFLSSSWAYLIDALGVTLGIFSVVIVISPLFYSHRIKDGNLQVRLGWLAAANVPLDSIASVEVLPAVGDMGGDKIGGVFVDDRFICVSSPTVPVVRLELNEPVRARALTKRRQVVQVDLGTETPESLMLAITRDWQ